MALTELAIKNFQPPAKGEKIYYDDDLPGFGVRVSQAGTKSFVLTHGPRRTRETIGRAGIITLKDARSEAKRLLAEYTLGKSRPRVLSWRSALDEYFEESTCRSSTIKSYKRHLKAHFPFGDTRLSEVTANDLHRDLDRLKDRPSEHHHAFTALRAFMKWAHRKHYIDKNPMERMQTPPASKPRARILTDDELKKVWNACDDDNFGRIVKLLVLTGQRVGEISQLTRDMIGDGRITLPSSLTKNGREHTFPIGSLAIGVIAMAPSTNGILFLARGKSSVPFSGFSKSKATLDNNSGVTGWTLHDLRRTFASGLASQGVSLHIIEKLLNHVSGSFGGIVGVYQRYDFVPEMTSAIETWEQRVQTVVA